MFWRYRYDSLPGTLYGFQFLCNIKYDVGRRAAVRRPLDMLPSV
jgi:hypothetical protein